MENLSPDFHRPDRLDWLSLILNWTVKYNNFITDFSHHGHVSHHLVFFLGVNIMFSLPNKCCFLLILTQFFYDIGSLNKCFLYYFKLDVWLDFVWTRHECESLQISFLIKKVVVITVKITMCSLLVFRSVVTYAQSLLQHYLRLLILWTPDLSESTQTWWYQAWLCLLFCIPDPTIQWYWEPYPKRMACG